MIITEITKNSLYCPYCDTIVETKIHCGEYKMLTLVQAIDAGFIEAV